MISYDRITTYLGEEPASPTARLMHAPSFNLHILAFLGFMTPIDVNVVKKGAEQTLLKHPRFSSVLVVDKKNCNNMSWKRINADINNHVITPSMDPNTESPDKFVEDYASWLSTIPMDLTKPLWEVHILNLQTSDANSTAIFKFHHSIGDGVSLISFLLACARKTSDPESFPTIPFKKQKIITHNDHSPKRFVHRIVSLDDIKLLKTAINVDLAELMEKESNGMWGNKLGIVLLPLTAINLQDDPLTYIRKAKATMDQKKRSVEAKLVNVFINMVIKLLGIKVIFQINSIHL
ncbi:hypothetical protein RD792_005474 [Penstemon davidsonii]|uniref:Diacylglycerol O-acyltransferase n=1 Tax=Penstemon davidsonii TaxID=160366 RepID=A0ABR0DKA9_9LAMI|nr:hypothetical protein RD792_005474 [Penstemon davidsonii]